MLRRILGAAGAVLLGAGVLGLSAAAGAADGGPSGSDHPFVEHPAPGVGLIPPAVWERSADGTVTRVL
jgi:hypothetical protein